MKRQIILSHLFRLAATVAIAALPCRTMLAHGGEDHGEAKPAPASTPGASATQLTTDAVTDQFELLLKYAPPGVGKNSTLRFFLSDYATNRPLAGATFSFSFKPAGVNVIQPPTMISQGVYDAVVEFPADTVYSLVATVNVEQRTDFLEVRNIYSGTRATRFLAEHGGAATAGVPDAGKAASGGLWWLVGGIMLAIVAMAVLAIWMIRKKLSRQASTE
ncbi:MAG: hypothetical protein ABIR47_11110 [Candidatus Kapaibacterium sp.]